MLPDSPPEPDDTDPSRHAPQGGHPHKDRGREPRLLRFLSHFVLSVIPSAFAFSLITRSVASSMPPGTLT